MGDVSFIITGTRSSRCSCIVFLIIFLFALPVLVESASPPKTAREPRVRQTYGGTVKIISLYNAVNLGLPSEPTNISDLALASPAIETLLNLDRKGNPVPWLATDWKIAKDAKSITLTLRKGVKFHDGTDFNAEAVKYVLDLFRHSTKPDLSSITSIDIINNHTVRLNLSRFESHLLTSLAVTPGMIPSPTYLKTHEKSESMLTPVGTGPFKLAEHKQNNVLRYTKFPGYWQKGKPLLDGIEFIFISHPVTALMSFKAEEADIFSGLLPKDSVDLLASGQFIVDKVPVAVYGLAPDGANPKSPFFDIRVRRAIEHAIDKERLVKTTFYDVYGAANQIAYSGSLNYNPSVKGDTPTIQKKPWNYLPRQVILKVLRQKSSTGQST